MIDPMQVARILQTGGDPRQAFIGMARREAGNNPVMANAIRMMESNDANGIEQLARNLCKERNIDPDKAIGQIRNRFGFT